MVQHLPSDLPVPSTPSDKPLTDSGLTGPGMLDDASARALRETIVLGREELLAAAEELQAVEGAVRDADETLRGLMAQTTEVVQVAAIIREVSEEIRLLALNAKILAAQMGRQAAGFDVVAERLIRLGSDTRSKVDEVERVLTEMHERARKSGERVRDAHEEVKAAVARTDAANDAFDSLYAGVRARRRTPPR